MDQFIIKKISPDPSFPKRGIFKTISRSRSWKDAPFDQMGGLGKASKVFGNKFDMIIEELSKELVA
jgi:hypothetical protein